MVEISYAATKPHLLGQNGKVKQVYFDFFAIALLNKGQNNVIDIF